MSKSLNSVHLIGRLGQDPELRAFPDGTPYCTFSLATDRSKPKGSDKEPPPDWHKIVLYQRQAEIARQYLHAGSLIFLWGEAS